MEESPLKPPEPEKAPKLPKKDLFELACQRQRRQKLIQKNAEQAAKIQSTQNKMNRNSIKLFQQKLLRQVKEVMKDFPEILTKQQFSEIFQQLGVLRQHPKEEKISGPRLKRYQNQCKFLSVAWAFICKSSQVSAVDTAQLIMILNSQDTNQISGLTKINPNQSKAEKVLAEFKRITQDQMAYKQKVSQKRQKKITSEANRDLTFKPTIHSELSRPHNPNSLYWLLYKKEEEKKQKIDLIRQQKKKQELQKCTFHPKITHWNRSMSTPFKQHQLPPSTEQKQLAHCTFKPDLVKKSPNRPKSSSMPKGYKETIERIRQANQEKKKLQELRDHIPRGENYEKMRKARVKPFSFLDRRNPEKQVILYVDVNVAPGKSGRIAIHHDDDLGKLAKNFCKAFSLDQEMNFTLETLLEEQLQAALASPDDSSY